MQFSCLFTNIMCNWLQNNKAGNGYKQEARPKQANKNPHRSRKKIQTPNNQADFWAGREFNESFLVLLWFSGLDDMFPQHDGKQALRDILSDLVELFPNQP